MQQNRASSGKNALLVAAGILASRLAGLVRDRVFAHYFGNTAAADAFRAAMKIPNLLQNLFGEGALSSSFIPVYAGLLASGDKEEARRVARAVGSLLVLLMAVLVLAGILATPFLIDLITPGFEGVKREQTIRMVRILFPGMGILVLSAWCLGILNSHRRFFLPYASPVVWNLAIIGALVGFGGSMQSYRLAEMVAWGAVAGSLLQFGVQLPAVLRLAGRMRPSFDAASSQVRTVFRNFIPGAAGRGVNQLSSWVDTIIASFLPTGAVAALAYTQTLYLLPVSLFGMSISNAELPEMASRTGSDQAIAEHLRLRLNEAMRRISFFIIPSMVGFWALGDSIIALVYQTGKFTRDDVIFVWAVLAGYTIGLLASTLGRLYASAFWALKDTKTPFYFATVRVALAAGLGAFLALPVPGWLRISPELGLAGLTLAAGAAAWVEFSLLRRSLNRRIGGTGLQACYMAKLSFVAIGAAAPAFALKQWAADLSPLISGSMVLAVFGVLYLAGAAACNIPQSTRLLQSIFRSFPRKP
ncbi:MAG TPA: murein biosynthesis integral membrane protein MurJ [Acidobacteriota bacterium]|nr:murein biosynthesis integral membrane protein MurJ [Acidobacteriota bacterium]